MQSVLLKEVVNHAISGQKYFLSVVCLLQTSNVNKNLSPAIAVEKNQPCEPSLLRRRDMRVLLNKAKVNFSV